MRKDLKKDTKKKFKSKKSNKKSKKYYDSTDSSNGSDSDQDDGSCGRSVTFNVESVSKNKANICSENKQIYNTVPIKIVDLNHETDAKTKRVVTGKGLVTSVAGVLQHARNSKKNKACTTYLARQWIVR